MIDYAKLAILVAIVATVFGGGWYVGNSRYVKYKAEVEVAAKAQEAHVESITKQQALVTKGIENEYNAKLALLRNYYANGVRQPNTSKLPTISNTTNGLDPITAYNLLVGQCSETTLMLTELQDWVKQQAGLK